MEQCVENRRVLVVGLARGGLACARMLLSLGARPVLSDMRRDIAGLDPLIAAGCENRAGEPSERLVAGCDLVVISPAVPIDAPVCREAKRLGVPLAAELEIAARHTKGVQIGITGTNGKTTTSAWTGAMLEGAGKRTFVAGNIGLPLSAVALSTEEADYTVVEVSSFQLEAMERFHPHVAALLNLTPDHLNRHGDMERYGALKEGMLRNQTEEDVFVYNAEDAFCREVAARARARAVPFSRRRALTEGAWVEGDELIVSGRALCPVSEISLPGPHNLENALAAAAVASALEVPAAVIRNALRRFQGVPHRMETVRTLRGVRYINDSKGTNPESSICAVQSAKTPTVLIAGGEDKGARFDAFARAIADSGYIFRVVLIGRAAEGIRAALAEAGYTAVTEAGVDFEKAVRVARGLTPEGGTVLLSPACASFDMFKDFEERGNIFKAIVNDLE